MKAKLISEVLGDIFKPKTEENIISDIKISKTPSKDFYQALVQGKVKIADLIYDFIVSS